MVGYDSEGKWKRYTNIYEVNIRQYSKEGNFNSFRSHLPRLKRMGVEVLWLMPITPISHKNRLGTLGSYYAASSYVGTNPEFGSLIDFKELVDDIHALDMKIIIDWVANHTGHDHEWTMSNPEYYIRDEKGNFTERNGWSDVIDLDYSNEEMREQMIASMRFWVKEFNIDGFRCDMAHLVPLDFWKNAKLQCDALKPLLWLAETEEINYHHVFDLTYSWKWMHATTQLIKQNQPVNQLLEIYNHYKSYPDSALKLYFTSNHDENSWNGTEYEKYGRAVKPLSILACLWEKGVPLLYSGQELPNFKRLSFFEKDFIEWKETCELESFFQALFILRKSDAIGVGTLEKFSLNHPNVIAFMRVYGDESVLVIVNLSSNTKLKITINHKALSGKFKNIFSNFEYHFEEKETFELMAYDFLVYKK